MVRTAEYDYSIIRHGMEVPIVEIFSIPINQRALLRMEEEGRRLDSYEKRVREALKGFEDKYELSRFKKDNKLHGLIIERVK